MGIFDIFKKDKPKGSVKVKIDPGLSISEGDRTLTISPQGKGYSVVETRGGKFYGGHSTKTIEGASSYLNRSLGAKGSLNVGSRTKTSTSSSQFTPPDSPKKTKEFFKQQQQVETLRQFERQRQEEERRKRFQTVTEHKKKDKKVVLRRPGEQYFRKTGESKTSTGQKVSSFELLEVGEDYSTKRIDLEPSPTIELIDEGNIQRQISNKLKISDVKILRGESSFKERVQTFGLATVGTVVGGGIGLFELGKGLLTEPVRTIKNIPGGIDRSIKQIGTTLKTGSPELITGSAVGEVLFLKGTGKAIKATGRGLDFTKTILSPSFKRVKEGKIRLPSQIEGRDFVNIELRGGVKSTSEPLSKQIKLAGKITDVASAQRGLFSVLKREIVVDKPLPTPKSPPLERAFFGTGKGKLRTSRLGVEQKDAGLLDILAGEITFKRSPKPQAVLFEGVQIEALPRRLGSVERKLKIGKSLTTAEERALVKFQLTPSGKFKPIGFLSRESEVVLSPGELILGRKVGKTIVKGRGTDIFRGEVIVKKGKGKRTARITDTEIDDFISKSRVMSSDKLLSRSFVSPSRAFGGTIAGLSRFLSPKRPGKRVRSFRNIGELSFLVGRSRGGSNILGFSEAPSILRTGRTTPRPSARRGVGSPKRLRGGRALLTLKDSEIKPMKSGKIRAELIEPQIYVPGFTGRTLGIKTTRKKIKGRKEMSLGIRGVLS